MKIKIILLLSCTILVLMVLSSCYLFEYQGTDLNRDYIKYNVEELPDGSLKLILGEDIYTTRDNFEWYPNNKVKEDFSNIIGICEKGYIFKTSSDNCLYIDSLRGTKPYNIYKNDYEYTPVSKEYIKEGKFISYDDEGYSEKDKGPTIDATSKIEEIIDIYFDNNKYIKKDLNYKNIVGKIVLKNKIDEGLYFSTSIYKENNDYYMGIKWNDGLYAKCNEIIPEDITKLEEYKKEAFGF